MTGRRIVLVEFSPSGGLFQFAAQLGEALAAEGHDVHLITGPHPELASAHPAFRIHATLPTWHPMDAQVQGPLTRKGRRVIRAARLALAWMILLRQLRQLAPDLVLWSTWRFSMDALGVVAAARLLPLSTLGIIAHEPRPTRRDDTTVYKTGPFLDRLLPAAWRRMGLVFVLGEEARARCLANWEPAGPVIVIPHGDEAALRGDGTVVEVARTAPVVLFFGTWTAYKGIDVLLDCFPDVRRRVPAARLVLAGPVAGVDLPSVLQRVAEVDGVSARPGYVPVKDVAALFGAARVVVTPYLRASQSGVAHLAHTFDRPVVSSAVGDIPRVVCDGETGVLVPPGDVPALADALVSLLLDPELAQRLGSEGARRLAAGSSWAHVAREVGAGLDSARARQGCR